MFQIRVHLIATNGFPSHNFNSQAFLGNGQSRVNASHIVTVLVALVGWFAVHRLTAWRDRVNHKRKISTDFLIKAFQNLANAANREPSPQYFRDMEAAIADIQLFGSTSQIKMIETFTKSAGAPAKGKRCRLGTPRSAGC